MIADELYFLYFSYPCISSIMLPKGGTTITYQLILRRTIQLVDWSTKADD
jgi:hypothetical protein